MSRKRRGEDRDDVPFEKNMRYTSVDEKFIEGRIPNMFEYLVYIHGHNIRTRYLGVNCYHAQQRSILEQADDQGMDDEYGQRALTMLQSLPQNVTFDTGNISRALHRIFRFAFDEGMRYVLTPIELPSDSNITRGMDISIYTY